MKRLADRMLSGFRTPEWWTKGETRETGQRIGSKLPGVEKFLIDNVMDFYFSEKAKDHWGVWDDFPNIAPPFETFWMEGFYPRDTPPELIEKSKEMGDQLVGHGSAPAKGVAYWVQSHKLYEDGEWWGWAMTAYPFIPGNNGEIFAPSAMITLPIDKEGRPTRQGDLPYGLAKSHIKKWGVTEAKIGGGIPCGKGFEELARRRGLGDDDIAKWKDYFLEATINGFVPFMLALSFLHCKNVSRSQVSLKPKRHREQSELGSSRYTFKVLDIDPMKRILATEGRSGEVGLMKALHICRGHFAHYTEDAPLFGKYVGTYWKPQHTRGSARAGVVEKDYRVNTPELPK